jgi:hypothetical protein
MSSFCEIDIFLTTFYGGMPILTLSGEGARSGVGRCGEMSKETREGHSDRFLGRILSAGLAGLLILPGGALAAGRKSGAKVLVITAQASERIAGELIGVRNDAIVVAEGGGGSREIAIDGIASVRILRKSAMLPGILLGAVAGGAAGLGIASGRDSSDDEPFEGVFWNLIYAGGGAVVGGLLGGLTGGSMGADKTYDLTKMSLDEKSAFLSKLRKKARVANYQ